MMDAKPTCFVIMPFSETSDTHTQRHWDDHYEQFLKPLIEDDGRLTALKSKPLRGDVLHEILHNLALAQVVVADLTDHNANVFWELGVRLSYKYGTVTIAEQGTAIPFDLSHKGTLFYHPKNHIATERFRRDFKDALGDCLDRPDKCDSPVIEALSGRPGLFEIFKRDELVRRLDAIVLECAANYAALGQALARSTNNLGTKIGQGTMVTRIPTTHAVSLFASERYADASQDLYIQAVKLTQDLQGFVMVMHLWAQSQRPVIDEWIVKQAPVLQANIERFREDIAALRDQLMARH